MNHVLLGSAGSGLGVLQLLRYPCSAAGFTAQGKMVGLTGERLHPPPLSASRGRGGGWACTAHRACPPSSPSRGWSYTRGSQLGGHLRQGQRTTATRTPSPGGPQVHTLLSSRGPAWGSRDHVSSVEKFPEGPRARSVDRLGKEWAPVSLAAETQEQPGLRAPTHSPSTDKRKETFDQRDLEKGLVFIALENKLGRSPERKPRLFAHDNCCSLEQIQQRLSGQASGCEIAS